MPDPLTYGHLAETARGQAALAAVAPPPVGADEVVRDATELVGVLALVGRHARFLGRGAGPSNPALDLAWHVDQAVMALRSVLPAGRAGPGSVWAAPQDLLGTAHDLLSAQLGPRGEPRGPDAGALTHPGAVTAATGRLARLVVVVTDGAAARADHLRRHPLAAAPPTSPGDGPGRAPPRDADPSRVLRVARALDRLGNLRDAAATIGHSCDRPGLPAVLDEVTPLLGAQIGESFDLKLERLRHAAHVLTRPPVRSHHVTLTEFADLAAAISELTWKLADQARRHGPHPAQDAYAQVSTCAHRAALAWTALHQDVGRMRTLGFEGRQAARLAAGLRHQLNDAAATATAADLAALLRVARRAVVLLPDLATASDIAVRRLAGEGLLKSPLDAGQYGGPGLVTDDLLASYADTAAKSLRLVSACARLPGPQPTPGRAALLAATSPTTTVLTATRPPAPALPPLDRARQDHTTWLHDPHHGILTCDTDHLEQALCHPDPQLWDMLRPHARRLHLRGTESRITLAALVAIHAPEWLTPTSLAAQADSPISTATSAVSEPSAAPGQAASPPPVTDTGLGL
ncbi:hypothetical protein I6A84_10055 [Frankia sp. CNm7]|uniref:Uncharacterized protein n=1 Tax=Frankia nepalensis TaxID=1836974 RepID=A0A937RAK5_9ACTN|nr:hypothetical protein [Frankia nepalensis]MBL7498778.1 hypothetical protein [Frankia nepalensis]MBL7508358.1 hypothetical protein [Frankia nepalensis]MBL7518444.1 hypothetical protein [Frankia nepalensis]MBL7626187.1 hypothetical protein [Frankia nepalensis]